MFCQGEAAAISAGDGDHVCCSLCGEWVPGGSVTTSLANKPVCEICTEQENTNL